ncbi:hypothetical protein R1sor_001259 [Riccia sorocarpa]|uniref:Uncharacterized protein n=1 Tax=Riccia sorocarpa TaxID=122646 RepID=A0ABD3GVF8_9MARC
MGPAILRRTGVIDKIKQVWHNHPRDAGNAQRRWELAWIRVKQVLKTEKRQMQNEHRDIHDLRLEVNSLRKMLESEGDDALHQMLKDAENKLRAREQEEARTWRIRSRDKWLREGEAPTRYFYAQAKAKFTRESIQTLTTQEGQSTTDRTQIMAEVEAFYKQLYTREEITQQQTGCQIASPQDRFRYLGVLTGTDVLDEEITSDIKTKYEKRINYWANKMLPWPAKVILCRNILGTLPYYTLMTVGLSKQGMRILQKITRDFLWGTNSQGNLKKPLITWSSFEKRKEDGGLGWPPLQDMATAFLLKNVTKLLTGSKEEWVAIAEALINDALQKSSRPQEIKSFTTAEVLLMLDNFQTPASPTLNTMLKAWEIPPPSPPPSPRRPQDKELLRIFKAARIRDTQEFQPTLTIKELVQTRGITITPADRATLDLWENTFPSANAHDIPWAEANGWSWDNGCPAGIKCWSLTTKEWRKKLYSAPTDDDRLNQKWEISVLEAMLGTQ